MTATVYGASDRMYAVPAASAQTTSFTAGATSAFYPVSTASGALTATLPTAPPDQTLVDVLLIAQTGSNAVTIAAGGSDVINVPGTTSIQLTALMQGVLLQYCLSQGTWYETANANPASGSGAVSSVFGRTGAVVAAPNDYSFSQISGTASAGQLPAATAGAQGALQLGTDLGGTAAAPHVVATHLTAALPVSQGGLGFTWAPVTPTSSTTVTGVTVATLLAAGLTVPASGLAVGQVFRFRAWGVLTTTANTQTVNLGLYWGGVSGTLLVASGAQNPNSSGAVTNQAWWVEAEIMCETSGTVSVMLYDHMSFLSFSLAQAASVSVSSAASEQFVLGATPSANAVSITCNGFVSERRW
ncbi:MAG TPA: hypothetical protein VGG83_10720 [Trebonia sp.]|jgi:hypothetical protein